MAETEARAQKDPIHCDVVGGRLAQPHRRSDLNGFVNSRHVVFALGDDTRNVAIVKSNSSNLIRTQIEYDFRKTA